MPRWREQVQKIVSRIDECIKNEDDEQLTLAALAREIGYSEYYTSQMFSEISGMKLRDYIRFRGLSVKPTESVRGNIE